MQDIVGARSSANAGVLDKNWIAALLVANEELSGAGARLAHNPRETLDAKGGMTGAGVRGSAAYGDASLARLIFALGGISHETMPPKTTTTKKAAC